MKKVASSLFLILLFLNAFSQTIKHPNVYYAYKTTDSIKIDGIDNEKSWKLANKSSYFIDIEGDSSKTPYYDTYVKILWDSNYLYFFAELKEKHIWATLTKRESIIFYDNDFEIFIDPDGDNHNYYEFEFNAFSTEWDLLLTKPYRDGGLPLFSWSCLNMKSAVNINGSINNPDDVDSSWTIEIAIPLSCLKDAIKGRNPPKENDVFRINFSRVQWECKIENGKYVKLNNDEHNWVWSPQYAVNMHRPEYWGYLIFMNNTVDKQTKTIYKDKDFELKMELINVYYAQKKYFKKHNKYSDKIENLNINNIDIEIKSNGLQFTASFGDWSINQDSRIWQN